MTADTRFALIRTGRTWSVADTAHDNRIVEGGFFSRDAAIAAVLWWNINAPNFTTPDPAEDAQ